MSGVVTLQASIAASTTSVSTRPSIVWHANPFSSSAFNLMTKTLSATSPFFVLIVAESMKKPSLVSARAMSRISAGRSGATTRTSAVRGSRTEISRDARSSPTLRIRQMEVRRGEEVRDFFWKRRGFHFFGSRARQKRSRESL